MSDLDVVPQVEMEKENIADDLVLDAPMFKPPQLSPTKKPAKKSRSKSIGPGGLDVPLEVPLKAHSGNRRKSAFVPAVKSILATKEDEQKRKDARRKSLANRRVSFAPEATLHTWDVIECMADATTSSASSNSTRRASAMSHAAGALQSPNSRRASGRSPAIQSPAGLRLSPLKSPMKQKPLIVKSKKRRSSGIPPLNFNNPEDVFSSSPASEASATLKDVIEGRGSDGGDGDGDVDAEGVDNDDEDDDDTVRSLARTGMAQNVPSEESDGSTSSSARLNEALRQATVQAEIQGIEADDEDELTMELAGDETTSAFKSWSKNAGVGNVIHEVAGSELDAAFGSLSPVKGMASTASGNQNTGEAEQEDDKTMDMTVAVGGIMQAAAVMQEAEEQDATMDFTVAAGAIESMQMPGSKQGNNLKRRRSSGLGGIGNELGSPRKRMSYAGDVSKRASLGEGSAEDETMDLTTAIGGIKNQSLSLHAEKEDSTIDVSFGEVEMDFTAAVGGINALNAKSGTLEADEEIDEIEELSMELTAAIGDINAQKKDKVSPKAVVKPVSPAKSKSPAQSPARRKSARVSQSPAQLETGSPPKGSAIPRTPPKSLQNLPKNTPPSARSRQATPTGSIRRSAQKEAQSPATGSKVSPNKTSRVSETPPAVNAKKAESSPKKTQNKKSTSKPIPEEKEEKEEANNVSDKPTVSLSESIRNLSTPRKQPPATPKKSALTPAKFLTPKADTGQKPTSSMKKLVNLSGRPAAKATLTPRSKRKSMGVAFQGSADQKENVEDGAPDNKLHLRDFLEMTSIRFMDLSTSKRRHTVVNADTFNKENGDDADDDKTYLENYVTAAACTVPMLELYQHSCRELKKYITEGKSVIRTIENATYEENPGIFRDFVSAPAAGRAALDSQFKNMKTNARLLSKAMWYEWRSKLLDDLKLGLVKIADDFEHDSVVLARYGQSVDEKLPGLERQFDELREECDRLQAHADALARDDKEELAALRKQVVDRETEIETKKRKLAELQTEVKLKDDKANLLAEKKSKCIEETKEAQHVLDECRKWSSKELMDLKARVDTLEQKAGWAVASASGESLTLVHRPDLELFLQPSAFGPRPQQHSSSSSSANAPIALSYTGGTAKPTARPLTTAKRFFLQLLRAHLQGIAQGGSSLREVLALVRHGWAVAADVAEACAKLNGAYIVTETIGSDEKLTVEALLLLRNFPAQTKIRVRFEVAVGVSGTRLAGGVAAAAEVVYGEKLNEKRMGEALRGLVGVELEGARAWFDAVQHIESKLIAKTSKA